MQGFKSWLFLVVASTSTGVSKIIDPSVPDRRKFFLYFQKASSCIVYMFDR